MEYIVQLVDILAWPLVAVLAMLIFGRELKNTVKRLSSVETSAGKYNFDHEIKELENNLQSIENNKKVQNSEDSESWLLEMRAIAKLNPRAAIVEAWTSIEVACIELGMVQGTKMARFSPQALESFLKEIPNFDNKLLERVTELRRLRNRVIHGLDTDFEFIDADKYINLSNLVLNLLNVYKIGFQEEQTN